MTSFFPDVNVWLALSVDGHKHNQQAWVWLNDANGKILFSRFTQMGLLRLLTNPAVMSGEALRLGEAWDVYNQWLHDPRVEFYPETRGFDAAFREATRPFDASTAWKWIGDCYIMAFASEHQATIVTFDGPLITAARKQGCAAVMPKLTR